MREQNVTFAGPEVFSKVNVNNGKMKVLNFKEVARIIVEEKPINIEAGLLTDWKYTKVDIYHDGAVLTDVGCGYLGSKWATPAIIIEDKDGNEREVECYTLEDDYNSDEMWDNKTLSYLNENGVQINDNTN